MVATGYAGLKNPIGVKLFYLHPEHQLLCQYFAPNGAVSLWTKYFRRDLPEWVSFQIPLSSVVPKTMLSVQ
jgi:hypothetical protein